MRTLALLLLLASTSAAADGEIVRSSMGGDIDIADAPHGATLRTMGGDISVDRARGQVTAKTMGGDIRVRELIGSVDAGTMGGDVNVQVAGVSGSRSFELHSMGGSISLTLPADFSGTFEVELEQDRDEPEHHIVSDFPLEVRKSTRKHWFQRPVEVLNGTAHIGSGDARVRIKTIGGEITIRRK
jgi:DUF4097 and DUF4098 domain-containing protein YvlB